MASHVSEIAAFVGFFLYGSFFEWTLHKYFMHQPRWQYPFRAHALVHHGLFRTGDDYFLSDKKNLKKVRFAWWNAPLIIGLHIPAILLLQYLLGASILFGACAAIAVYYGLYEYLHYCMHIPSGRWIEQTRWFRWLDAHHHMHHKRHFNNLNVVLPLADAVFGSLIRSKGRIPVPDRKQGAYTMQTLLR
ncbi:MAG: fatty acid hydroxylase [Deltaproteobacteria bacterium]|nr:fatty acid hydroxylase [Deltaproteobacteria bacterium]